MVMTTPRTSSFWRNVRELTGILAISAASWFLAEHLSVFERLSEEARKFRWLGEAMVVGVVLTVCLVILSVSRWRGLSIEISNGLKLQDRLIQTAYHDSLTQLPNRIFFMSQLTQCVKRAKQRQDYEFAVVFMEVDHLKIVSDNLGQLLGDQIIMQISERLIGSIRRDAPTLHLTDVSGPVRKAGNDVLARYSGDEFAILLDDIRDPSDGIRVAERIQRNLLPLFLVDEREMQITVSIGIAVSASGYSAAEDVLRDASAAMRRARTRDESRYQMFDPTMHAAAVNRLKLEYDLRQAEDRGELLVYYQPIVSLHDGLLSGFEALIRWQRPGFGLVAPGQFIPLAEETGLIVPIGSWMLREACNQMHVWHLRFPSKPELTIAVNFSAKQFMQPNLVNQVDQILRETHMDPGSLNVEFTESVAMQDAEQTALRLNELKALGVHSSIDDFGTGYSSLSYLSRLSLDILKLDRYFVSAMESSNETRKIARAIISLAHNLGMDVVAEGIETVEQANEVRSLGCKYAQGYFFSKPMSQARVEALLGSGVRGADFKSHMKAKFMQDS